MGTGTACVTTLQITPLTLTAQGDGSSSRDGNKINLRSCHVNVYVKTATGANAPCVVKMFLWREKNSNGVVPTAADLLTDSTTLLLSRLNPDHAGHEYKMLWSKTLMMGFQGDGVSEPAGGRQDAHVTCYKKMNVVTTYNGSTAAQSACYANHLYFGIFCDTTAGGSPIFTATARVQWYG